MMDESHRILCKVCQCRSHRMTAANFMNHVSDARPEITMIYYDPVKEVFVAESKTCKQEIVGEVIS